MTMSKRSDQPSPADSPRAPIDDYRAAQAQREQNAADKREQLGQARTHGNAQGGTR
jgi:hypothetical protein